MTNKVFTKFGILWSTILVSIICILSSLLISFVYGSLVNMEELSELLIIAALCPTLIAPPVVHFYASLAVRLDESRQEQEDLNKNLIKANQDLTSALKKVKLLSACCRYVLFVKRSGMIVATGIRLRFLSKRDLWPNLSAVSARNEHTTIPG